MHLSVVPGAEEQAAELIVSMADLPHTHPSRARLRDAAITAWTPMAHRLARRYGGRGELQDDLNQVAIIGLIKAVDRFDPAVGAGFIGYAIVTIVGELKRHFRDRLWSIRPPRRIQEMTLAISRAREDVRQTLGREPTITDLAEHLGVADEAIIEGLESAHAYRAASLSRPAGADGDLELGETLGDDDREYDRTELHLVLGPAMSRLTPREQWVITMRFFGNQSQARIADQIGVSQMHVSRLQAQALAKLRDHLRPEAW